MPCESAVEWNVALDGNLDLLTLCGTDERLAFGSLDRLRRV